MYPMGDRLRARAVENLRSFESAPVERNDLRRAAVALVIVGAGIAGGEDATAPGHEKDRGGSPPGAPDRAEAVPGTPDAPDPDLDPQEAAFLLTRRAAGLRTHPGQWALPVVARTATRTRLRPPGARWPRSSASGSERSRCSESSTTSRPAPVTP